MSTACFGRVAAVALSLLVAAGCTDAGERRERRSLEMWFHASEGPERALIEDQVERFNESHPGITVLLRVLPEGPYAAQVADAAVDGRLPDVLDVDRVTLAGGEVGPVLPMEDLLPRDVLDSLVPEIAITGRVGRRLMGAPTTTDAVLLAADRTTLRAIDARAPSGIEDPWTLVDLERVLRDLTRHVDAPALELPEDDLELGRALAALVRSAGSPLVPPATPDEEPAVVDALTAPAAVITATIVARWLRDGLAAPAGHDDDDDQDEPAPLTLVRSGEVAPGHVPAVPPDLGGGAASVAVGHVWVIPESSRQPSGAAELVAFLLSPDEVTATIATSGGVPTVRAVLDQLLESRLDRHRSAVLAARLLLAHRAPPVAVASNPSAVLRAYAAAVLDAGEGRDVLTALEDAAG